MQLCHKSLYQRLCACFRYRCNPCMMATGTVWRRCASCFCGFCSCILFHISCNHLGIGVQLKALHVLLLDLGWLGADAVVGTICRWMDMINSLQRQHPQQVSLYPVFQIC